QGVTFRMMGTCPAHYYTRTTEIGTAKIVRHNYLMAPMVKPAMKRSTKKLYRMATGTLAMKQPAMREPQKYTSPWTRKVGTPTLTVIFRTEEMKVTAETTSCITRGTLKIESGGIPAREN